MLAGLMRVRDYARALVEATALADKLRPPPNGPLRVHTTNGERGSDRSVGPDAEGGGQGARGGSELVPIRLTAPGRPDNLRIRPARSVKVPKKAAMAHRDQRGRILHALANHELQAIELFAWAVLAFPDMPIGFHNGLLAIIADEQRHLQLYMDCMAPLGVRFGDLPVTGHFWHKIPTVSTPLQFVCTMGLTFENANLDFANEYTEYAQAGGDEATVRALEVVHRDEIRHVRFAWIWLNKLKSPTESAWDAYVANLTWPLSPERARGKTFDEGSRVAAGLSPEFIARLSAVMPKRPSGAPR